MNAVLSVLRENKVTKMFLRIFFYKVIKVFFYKVRIFVSFSLCLILCLLHLFQQGG